MMGADPRDGAVVGEPSRAHISPSRQEKLDIRGKGEGVDEEMA